MVTEGIDSTLSAANRARVSFNHSGSYIDCDSQSGFGTSGADWLLDIDSSCRHGRHLLGSIVRDALTNDVDKLPFRTRNTERWTTCWVMDTLESQRPRTRLGCFTVDHNRGLIAGAIRLMCFQQLQTMI